MTPKRQAFQEKLLSYYTTIEPGGVNAKRYKEFFDSLDDEAFDNFVKDLRDKKDKLKFYIPNMKVKVSINDILKVADEIGLVLCDRIILWDEATQRFYITPQRYLITRLPVRRVKQFLADGISTPEGDTTTDLLTGQVIRPDKGSAVSLPEITIYIDKGLDKVVEEWINLRGGNIKAYASLKAHLHEKGIATMDELGVKSEVRSAVIASVLMRSMHLENNLVEGL